MKLITFLISLQFIFINTGRDFRPTDPHIIKLDIPCLMVGVTTYDEYKTKLYSCGIHKDIKQKLLNNVENGKDDYEIQDVKMLIGIKELFIIIM